MELCLSLIVGSYVRRLNRESIFAAVRLVPARRLFPCAVDSDLELAVGAL